MGSKYDGFTIAELQHLYVGLLLAERYAFRGSPIVGDMLLEVAEALDGAIRREDLDGG